VEDGKDLIFQQKEQFASAVEAGREAYQEATGEDKNRLATEELGT
jgi:hypothetical protein